MLGWVRFRGYIELGWVRFRGSVRLEIRFTIKFRVRLGSVTVD